MILNAAQGERREAPPRKIAAGLWESEKTWEMFFRAETPKQWRGDRPGRLCGMFCLQK